MVVNVNVNVNVGHVMSVSQSMFYVIISKSQTERERAHHTDLCVTRQRTAKQSQQHDALESEIEMELWDFSTILFPFAHPPRFSCLASYLYLLLIWREEAYSTLRTWDD